MTDETATEAASSASLLSLGDAYFVDEDYTEAMDTYTAALVVLHDDNGREHFRILSHRSAAFYQLKRYQEALEDAQEASKLLLSSSSSNVITGLRPGETELCSRRQGMAAFQLERYEEARKALESAKQLATLNKRDASLYDEWIQRCNHEIQQKNEMPEQSRAAAAAAPPASSLTTGTTTGLQLASANTPPKYQYYQTDKVMTVAILEPHVRPEHLHVTWEPTRLTVTLQRGSDVMTVLSGTLYDEIDINQSRVQIRDEKVWLKLRKVQTGEWHELWGQENKKIGSSSTLSSASKPPKSSTTPQKLEQQQQHEIPSVSSSSDSRSENRRPRPYASHRNWDEIEKSLEAANNEEDDTPKGDEAANALFQQIYANADEDTRRAMVKSFQTSGGTVLSTNWNEVSKTDYEQQRTAPRGMEWKTWEGDKLPMEEDEED